MSIEIHGKQYITVAERLAEARKSGKDFEIVASEPLVAGDRIVWRCCIKLDGKLFYGSAEAHLNAKAGSADATDPFACAETSAVGRALGFAGFGAIDSIASADEIARSNATPAQIVTVAQKLAKSRQQAFEKHLVEPEQWESFKTSHLGSAVADSDVTAAQYGILYNALKTLLANASKQRSKAS